MKKKILVFLLVSLYTCFFCFGCTNNKIVFTFNNESKSFTLTANKGELIDEPTRPTKKGYTFLGWYAYDELWNFNKDIAMNDTTLEAVWLPNTYMATYDYNGGEKIKDTELVMYDSIFSGVKPTRKGYTFEGWFYDGQKIDTWTIDENVTISAQWKAKTTKIVFDTGGANQVCNDMYVQYDSYVTFPKLTKDGYKLHGWSIEFDYYHYSSDDYVNPFIWNFDAEEVVAKPVWFIA